MQMGYSAALMVDAFSAIRSIVFYLRHADTAGAVPSKPQTCWTA